MEIRNTNYRSTVSLAVLWNCAHRDVWTFVDSIFRQQHIAVKIYLYWLTEMAAETQAVPGPPPPAMPDLPFKVKDEPHDW